LRWASPADPFGLIDLAQRGPDRADREEEVGIGVAAGGEVTPVDVYGHAASSRLPSGNPIRTLRQTTV
jgi:hypothetical protein